MAQQIRAFGGVVEKYAGDAIMAVFGVPQVHEDDAERAVRAAVAMRESLVQLNPMFEQEYGARLELRVGIATGEAVAVTESDPGVHGHGRGGESRGAAPIGRSRDRGVPGDASPCAALGRVGGSSDRSRSRDSRRPSSRISSPVFARSPSHVEFPDCPRR